MLSLCFTFSSEVFRNMLKRVMFKKMTGRADVSSDQAVFALIIKLVDSAYPVSGGSQI